MCVSFNSPLTERVRSSYILPTQEKNRFILWNFTGRVLNAIVVFSGVSHGRKLLVSMVIIVIRSSPLRVDWQLHGGGGDLCVRQHLMETRAEMGADVADVIWQRDGYISAKLF